MGWGIEFTIVFFQNGWDAEKQEAGTPESPNWWKSNALKTMRARPELARLKLLVASIYEDPLDGGACRLTIGLLAHLLACLWAATGGLEFYEPLRSSADEW